MVEKYKLKAKQVDYKLRVKKVLHKIVVRGRA